MAVEKNPFDLAKSNVIPMDIGVEEESMTSIQPDDDGGVTVEFGAEESIIEETSDEQARLDEFSRLVTSFNSSTPSPNLCFRKSKA